MTVRKAGFGRRLGIAEPYPAKAPPRHGFQIDSQRTSRPQAIRHHAFATSLIDGRKGTVGNDDIEAAAPRGDSGGKASRASADDKDIRCARQRDAVGIYQGQFLSRNLQ
jgi:hypothetical protein